LSQAVQSESQLVLGIDEAGRGPALGPLVLAAVALEPAQSRRLSRAGVVDSKAYGAGDKARRKRLALARLVHEVATFVGYEICDVAEVDAWVVRGGLNDLERERASRLIERAPPAKRIVADGKRLFAALGAAHPQLEARDKGESVHVSVAAASLCAKVRRDALVDCIAARYESSYGELRGGGYVNAGTRAFTQAYVADWGALPPEARHSWPWPGDPGIHRIDADASPRDADTRAGNPLGAHRN